MNISNQECTMGLLSPVILILLIGFSDICRNKTILVDKKRFYTTGRLKEDSIRCYENVEEVFKKKKHLMEKKTLEFDYETIEYYKEITHPNIVETIAMVKLESQLCIIYPEQNQNMALKSWLEENSDLDGKFRIFLDICQAVKYLLKNKKFHTNINASDITLTENLKPTIWGLTFIQKCESSNCLETNINSLETLFFQILESIRYSGLKKFSDEDTQNLIRTILLAPEDEPSLNEIISYLNE